MKSLIKIYYPSFAIAAITSVVLFNKMKCHICNLLSQIIYTRMNCDCANMHYVETISLLKQFMFRKTSTANLMFLSCFLSSEDVYHSFFQVLPTE